MSIKVDMTSSDLDRQIALLRFYPEIVEKHFVPVLKQDVKALEGRIRSNVPILTGKAQASFTSKVIGKGINLTGAVGWFGKNAPWYINVVEYGARSHTLNKGSKSRNRAARNRFLIYEKAAKDLGWENKGGTHVMIKGKWVTIGIHPGFSKRGFMAAGYSAMKPIIEADMRMANEGVVKELALK